FNGEIYNFQELRTELETCGHRFVSGTDTEVILHAYLQWGLNAVSRLRGMFAFAIWDSRSQQIHLVRDRLGIKPLYYTRFGNTFAFASEPKSILALPGFSRAPSSEGLTNFLALGFTTGVQSAWEGILRLPPASTLTVEVDGKVGNPATYWSIPEIDTKPASVDDAVDELQELLKDATREHLVSDVPTACFLSGGLDSSIVASYVLDSNPETCMFTAEFEGWARNETDVARTLSAARQAPHVVSRIASNELANEGVLDLLDEPLADSSVFPTNVVCGAIRQHAKVALSGDGGDELMAGYTRYRNMSNGWRRQVAFSVASILHGLGIGREFPAQCRNWFDYYRLLVSPGFAEEEARRLFPWFPQAGFEPLKRQFDELTSPNVAGETKRWQRFDAATYLVDNNLTRMDRLSMLHSLEVRVPILDHRVVEWAFRVPDQLLVSEAELKIPFRRIAERILPKEFLSMRKLGFSAPLNALFPTEKVTERLRTGSLVEAGMVHEVPFQELLRQPNQGNWSYKIWLLFVLDRWVKCWMLNESQNR
ncbi:MAG: asparagine synthase (glutamine-hydrolyzing), partial [Planctomycetaceae bacterium]|nr:asparagine synthase (glutamine-hydrolyzing) [Planctomycetaceae bacterium]